MGKHLNAKQRELEKKLKNQQKGMMYTKSTDAVSVPTLQAAPTKAEVSQNTTEASTLITPGTLKTKAKAMGLKSTLVFDDKIVVTSFLNSKTEENEKCAHIEKIADCNGQTIVEHPRMFNTSINAQKVDLSKDNDETNYPNPAFEDCGRDYINIKSALEKRVFGKTYNKDNLHVQIAYNIFDIKKIIGTYINNITYIFYNLSREEYNAKKDIVGTQDSDYISKILNNTSAYFTYFDGVFKQITDRDSNKDREIKNSYNALVLKVLYYLRQFCMHGNTYTKRNEESFLSDTALYNAKDFFAKADPQINGLIDAVYADGIKTINNDFMAHAKNNMYIICEVYKNEAEGSLMKEYYDFVVRKEGNNLGFNTRQLREILIDKYVGNLRDKKHNTFRNKLYTVLGFILVKEIKRNPKIQDSFIARLRANQNGDEGKLNIYDEFASKIWSVVSSKFNSAITCFDEESLSKFKGYKDIDESLISRYGITVANTDTLVKILYFLCKFLDGKEINELCCALINKFDNINDLIQTAAQCGENIEFVKEYKLFINSKDISDQIRIVKSISKMKPELSKIGEALILDAIDILGYKINKYKYDADGNRLVDSNNKPVYSEEYCAFKKDFFETCELDDFGRIKYDKKGKPVINHRRRNFIINNVLSSKWFFYVAKYNRPSECQKFMKSKKLIALVLKDVPETQIARYYHSVTDGMGLTDSEAMRATLINLLHDFSIKDVLSSVGAMTASENKRQIENSRKERMKAIVKLYLTVVYLIAKSLVKVNTRFSIAFSAYERDVSLLADENESVALADNDDDKWKKGNYVFALTKHFLDNDEPYFDKYNNALQQIKGITDPNERRLAYRANDKVIKHTHFNLHSYKYVKYNYEEISKVSKVITAYRNNVQHLNVINNITKYLGDISEVTSYYSLYCYILQRLLLDDNNNDKFAAIKEKLIKFGTYNKDFMWLINVPFAYNLPRYKNLSNEEIFYDVIQNK